MPNNLQQIHLKRLQNESFKKNSKMRFNWNLIENKIADKITRVSKTSPQNILKMNERILKKNIYLQN